MVHSILGCMGHVRRGIQAESTCSLCLLCLVTGGYAGLFIIISQSINQSINEGYICISSFWRSSLKQAVLRQHYISLTIAYQCINHLNFTPSHPWSTSWPSSFPLSYIHLLSHSVAAHLTQPALPIFLPSPYQF